MLIGIVGIPNAGKSTFFKAATLADVLIAPYPFATIKPNHGMAYVKIEDLAPEFGKVSNPREGYVKGEKGKWRFVPFELMDVAGLVEGASKGKGLGNEFLNDLAGADAFIHVIDMSGETDGEGKPVGDFSDGLPHQPSPSRNLSSESMKISSDQVARTHPNERAAHHQSPRPPASTTSDAELTDDSAFNSSKYYYPGNDIKIIERELDLWYLGILNKVWKVFARTVEMQKKKFAEAVAAQFSGLKVSVDDVKSVLLKSKLNVEKPTSWSEEDVFYFARSLRRHTKPMIIAANKMDRPKARENFEKVREEFDYPIVACFAEGELALREADKHGLIEYIPGEKDFKILADDNDLSSHQPSPARPPHTTRETELSNNDSIPTSSHLGKLTEKQKKALDEIQKILNEYGGTGVQEILNKVVFEILKCVAVFPAGDKLADSKGNVLPDCYLMPHNSTALDFAFRLHSDIGKNFVKAIHVRTKRAVGKDYKLQNRDGLEILTK